MSSDPTAILVTSIRVVVKTWQRAEVSSDMAMSKIEKLLNDYYEDD